MFSAAAQAAVRVAAHSGYASTDPFVLQESNNTVVWLRPHAVIAKVGKWPHSADALALEHAVATAISADRTAARRCRARTR
jgi:hypothetical protein